MLRSTSLCSHIIQPTLYKNPNFRTNNLVNLQQIKQYHGVKTTSKLFTVENSVKSYSSSQSVSNLSSKLQKSFVRTYNTPTENSTTKIIANEVEPIAVPIESQAKAQVSDKKISKIRELAETYASLSKVKLGSLVVMTTAVGYIMAPMGFNISTFIISSIGTGLAVASANTFNQVIEVEKDAKMARTWNRVLPTGKITKKHAIAFAVTTGTAGTALLAYFVNPLAASLAFANIALYAGIYTPLKQIHPINTHVGAVVGAIPPMIGWAARTGGLEPGAWALAALLYVWQLPHFHALSWGLRNDYAKGDYKMLATVSPQKLPRSALLWSAALLPLGAFCVEAGITNWCFGIDSLAIDAYVLYHAYNFYKDNSNSNARKLFFSTLAFLPIFMILMIFHKVNSDDEEKKKLKMLKNEMN